MNPHAQSVEPRAYHAAGAQLVSASVRPGFSVAQRRGGNSIWRSQGRFLRGGGV